MSGGKGASSRAKIRKAQQKQAAKKAAKKMDKLMAKLPQVSEDDLLAFQLAHFGDDSRPANWFVDAETALHCQPDVEEYDGLGYYEDGVKRTLTDEQIAMFRRTECFQLKYERLRLEEEQAEEQTEEPHQVVDGAGSPVSDVSSLEDELLAYAFPAQKKQTSRSPAPPRKPPRKSRSKATVPSGSWKERRSQHEVPYDQRHKRKWEDYVGDVDPTEGSLTHRRMARELDAQQTESIEMDY